DPGHPTPPPPEHCKELEAKLIECKALNVDCPDAEVLLAECHGPGGQPGQPGHPPPPPPPPPPPANCDVFATLFASCHASHPNDPLCDQILAAWQQCMMPPKPPPPSGP
ncbi:MAG: hypothetical protein JNK82_06110, partial [Myxococcaceae bacterium]|nr:hypothetical protein [Myxococcaceae bacterium]